jgi:hypothetical protein
MNKKYGNDSYWCFVGEVWDGKEVAIWKGPSESEEIIARATNKFEAKNIVDALLNNKSDVDKHSLGKKELAFLEFLAANAVEPYSTMANNAILWKDVDAYNKLKSDFAVIYS